MRFLFLSSDKFPPFRVDVAVLFGREMVARGHVIDWVLQAEADCVRAYETQWAGSNVYVGPTDNGGSRWARLTKHIQGFLHDMRGLRRASRGSYDFVQVKDKFAIAVFALMAARLRGMPLVYWLSFPFPEASLHRVREGTARYPLLYRIRAAALGFLLYRVILPRSSHVFVQSEKMKKDLAAKGVESEKMTPVPMGIDAHGFPAPNELVGAEESRGAPVLAYLGTLTAVRRLDFLVGVLARVRDRHPGVRLVFVGDAENSAERRLILDEAARLKLSDAVEITGFLPQREALRIVAAADVCLSPFYPTFILESTSPTKLVEYMALGRPVVANEHPEQSLVIAESRGGICVPWNESAFATAICELLDEPGEARAMGQRGREYVLANRTYERIAEQVDVEYGRLLENFSQRRSQGTSPEARTGK